MQLFCPSLRGNDIWNGHQQSLNCKKIDIFKNLLECGVAVIHTTSEVQNLSETVVSNNIQNQVENLSNQQDFL